MKKIILVLLALFLSASLVQASYISLNTSLTTKVSGGKLQLLIKAKNRGDESAYNVQAELFVNNKKIMLKKAQELVVDESYEAYKTVNLDLKNPGQYPIVLIMHYTDANQYPFSAPTVHIYNYQSEDLPTDLVGRIKGDTFWQTGKVQLKLKNLDQLELKSSVELFLPRELSVNNGKRQLVLPAKGTKELSFDLDNFTALSGSTYQVFAISQYLKEGKNRTVVTPGTVKIIEEKSIFGFSYTYYIIALLFLLVGFILIQIFKKD